MTARIEYLKAREEQTRKNWSDDLLWLNVHGFTQELIRTNYVKNFTWMGRPILQYPMDLMVLQELICQIQPDIVIETGVAFGGTLSFYATILDRIQPEATLIGIDIEFRDGFVAPSLPIGEVILVEGSSIAVETVEKVYTAYRHIKSLYEFDDGPAVLISLDSNHTHDHVLQELKLYSPLVSVGSYIVVFDTAIEQFMTEQPADRPWGPGNNPATAVQEFLKGNTDFEVDKEIQTRALITAAPGGWLRRVK